MNSELVAGKITTQASGHLSIEFSESETWHSFPEYTERILSALGGEVKMRNDAVGIRIWNIQIEGCPLDLVFEDFPDAVSLESSSDEGDELIRRIPGILAADH